MQLRELIPRSWLAVAFCTAITANSVAQESAALPPARLNLSAAVDFALASYPSVRSSVVRLSAARESVGLARTAYLPRTDLLWQSNRATRNNIFGALLPQSVIPPISGPVLSETSDRGVWGSAGGILFSWEPFDFGYRGATVDEAKATQQQANAQLSLTRLDVAARTADAFLTLAASMQRTQAAQADVDRREVFAQSVHVLVDQELRPGVDASRADAEFAAAKIQLVLAQEAERDCQADLEQILGVAGKKVEIDTAGLLDTVPATATQGQTLKQHPAAQVEAARIAEAAAREREISRSYYPRFNLQGSFSGRGSGANPDGTFGTGTDGLGLMRRNWAVGLTATFPAMDIVGLHFKRSIEQANERAQHYQYEETLQELTNRSEKASAAYKAAQEIAANTPTELQAAQQGEAQSRARYQAGLATVVEVADSQRLLLRAQIDDNLARLSVWHALLSEAFAGGRLEGFLDAVRKSEK
jgi:outer membrane protein TolC